MCQPASHRLSYIADRERHFQDGSTAHDFVGRACYWVLGSISVLVSKYLSENAAVIIIYSLSEGRS